MLVAHLEAAQNESRPGGWVRVSPGGTRAKVCVALLILRQSEGKAVYSRQSKMGGGRSRIAVPPNARCPDRLLASLRIIRPPYLWIQETPLARGHKDGQGRVSFSPARKPQLRRLRQWRRTRGTYPRSAGRRSCLHAYREKSTRSCGMAPATLRSRAGAHGYMLAVPICHDRSQY